MATVDVQRTSVTAGRKTTTTVAHGVVVDPQPMKPDAIARLMPPSQISAEVLYNQYAIYTWDPFTGIPVLPCPDIRLHDQLVDSSTANADTGTPATTYSVLGVNRIVDPLGLDYLVIHAQVQAQPSQAGG